MAISPTGWELRDLTPVDFVHVRLRGPDPKGNPLPTPPPGPTGESGRAGGGRRHQASSEWRLHEALYRLRDEAGAVVHTHSPRATAVATLERSIPAIHYYLALLGGEVPLVPYAPFGSAELAALTRDALKASPAHTALLAHHGAIAIGRTPAEALLRAEILEHLAAIYLSCLSTGLEIPLLTTEQLREAEERMSSYGHKEPEPSQHGCTPGAMVAPRKTPIRNRREGTS